MTGMEKIDSSVILKCVMLNILFIHIFYFSISSIMFSKSL